MTDLADLSAVDLLALYRAGKASPVEVTQAVFARMEKAEPVLCATWALDPEGALAAARASEARWRAGNAGALDGVPITIKENIATKGVPVPLGTAATDLVPAAADAPPAARVREAGAVILGKTTMPDYGMLSSGVSSFHKLARNPWNPAFNPGGSSAGAGAAAAAGYGPLHLGTDIGGSIRLPASWCGIVGHKPSNGRVPIDPPYIGRAAGPMTRTVADTALLMSVLSQPDARDHMSLPPADIAWGDLARDLKGVRIAVVRDIGIGDSARADVLAALDDAAARFAAAGAIVIPVGPFLLPEMLEGLDQFWRTRSYADAQKLSPEKRAMLVPFIRDWIAPAAAFDGVTAVRGLNRIVEMSAAAVAAIQGYDFMLMPTAPMPSYPAEWPMPSNDPARAMAHIGFTVAFNMSGQPAASVNASYTEDGLPIGIQIVGHRFDDLGVLQMAHAWEQLRPVQRPWPMV